MVRSGKVVFGDMDEVVFGQPAAQAIPQQMERLGAKRALLMVSGTLNRTTDEIKKIRAALGDRCVAVFDAMPAHSPRQAVVDAAEMGRAANADVIVTVGGGSITDGAKSVQLCLANDVRTADDMRRIRVTRGVAPPMNPPVVRQISVPTTVSGGEFSDISGITNEKSKVKEMFRHPLVMPSAVILDPAITVHTPEWLWLSTGIRAVDHCVEGFCSKEAHPYSEAQALRGLRLLSSALPRVKANPNDIDARLDCQLGTWLAMGSLVAGVPMGASHGIGYILGGGFDVPHGYTSCVMLPAVMRWNKAEAENATRQTEISAAMGQPGKDAGEALDRLIRGLGMPRSLRDINIGREHFEQISEQAMHTPWVPRNPRKIDGPAQIREILEIAA